MKNNLSILLQFLILVAVAFGGFYLYSRFYRSPSDTEIHNPPPKDSMDVPDISATQLSEGGNTVPEPELVYIKVGDLAGLQTYMDSQAKNWLNISTNIHSQDVFGAASSSVTIQNNACDAVWPLNKLCRYASIEYTAIYKGVMTGGTQANFVLHPSVTLGDDWTETKRELVNGKMEVTFMATATVTFSGNMCVTSVEENTPTSVETGQAAPQDNSYTIKTKDERLLPDIGPWVYDLEVNEEALRIDSYKKAKTIALLPDKVNTLYSYIEADMMPGGEFYEAVKAFYTPELAQIYRVKGWNIVMSPTRGDPLVRCDGTNVNK